MNYILAVSGGVDSVVLLDLAIKKAVGDALPQEATTKLIVAHFDHGIRAESGADADFVKQLAKKYQLTFELGRGNLGPDASEDVARKARYKFFEKLKRKYKPATIVTAHHQDDLIETMAINVIRGTGWRGLAPMSGAIERPLLGLSKVDLVNYAIGHKLEWVEDNTNYSPKYLRNRVRQFLLKIQPAQRQELLILNAKQQLLRRQVDNLLSNLAKSETLRGAELFKLPEEVARECLHYWTHGRLTSEQVRALLIKLKSAKSGDLIQPGGGLQIGAYQDQFTITKLAALQPSRLDDQDVL